MRKILHTLILVITLMVMTDFSVCAQRRGATHGSERINTERRKESARPVSNGQSFNLGNNGGRHNVTTSGRPGIGSSRPTTGANRPTTGTNRPTTGTQPSTANRPTTGTRPGNNNNPNVGSQPSNGRPGAATHNPGNPGNNNRPNMGGQPSNGRPGVGSHNPVTPGFNRPGGGIEPNHRPGIANRPGQAHAVRPPMLTPPNRPYRPVIARPHYRPVPPPAWRPRAGLPIIRGILGLTFGAAIGVSLDYLYNTGYTVDGYDNNIVYLRNVPALNYIWTDGALYYGANGLDASSFYYSTPGYDLARYNAVYATLVNTYGQPVMVNNAVGSLSSTWFGGNNGYITLSFGAGTAGRFLTTLTLGM